MANKCENLISMSERKLWQKRLSEVKILAIIIMIEKANREVEIITIEEIERNIIVMIECE
jgi:hypothetical protein